MLRHQELKNRFLRDGLSSFDQIEILEFLLSLKIDGSKTRKFARSLYNKFSSLNGVIDEPVSRLEKISGFQQDYLIGLKLPHYVANLYLLEKVKRSPVFSEPQTVFDYLIHSMRGRKKEYFKVMYLNSSNILIKEEDLFIGTFNSSVVSPREIIKSAIDYNAAGLILVHNHPSGNPNPSEEDKKTTRQMKQLTDYMGILLLDHVIIGEDKYYSFAEERNL